MPGWSRSMAVRMLTAVIAAILALHGVLPQAHLAWGHQHTDPVAAACSQDDEHEHGEPSTPAHPDCPVCDEFQTAAPLSMPAPAVAVPSGWLLCAVLRASPATASTDQVEIRWSLARGPPRA